ncbi:vWA domain-containing protein [Desulfovibrio subterraneus]|uniref:VWA domain-containing protein n=1 Tax=Desulfovibrio subterraneus TaxID=2718620 RepID=A0A7J0BG12_9BACT|nr:pilus assembly protein TadG-related protein [Desulfovibrio subterraneus]GFM32142.1 VWA domain-containing protein [Desulfovibrio subterraneus]
MKGLHTILRRFYRDEHGGTATIIAVLIPVILGISALALDSALLYTSHSRLQAATDAAALAGSLELPYDPDMTLGKVALAATDYLNRNYAEAQVDSIAPGPLSRSVQVNTKVTVPLLLMPILGINDKTIKATATAGFNKLEVVFVIDNSGSMKGTPINETNAAASKLVNLIMPDGLKTSVKAGLVPFRGKVHIPSGVDGLADGCRNADGTLSPDLNDEYYKTTYRYPRDSRLRVDMDTCDVIPRTQGLTDDKAVILTAISKQNGLGSGSGTIISEGLKWGRHVLTKDAPYTEASDDPEMRKIIILLTDGDTEDGKCGGNYAISYTPNNYWTNAFYGMLDMNSHCENSGKLNQYSLDEAAAAKAAGIEIFTIRFGVSDSVDVDLMKTMASSSPGTTDHYFDAPSAYDIDDVFMRIGRQLGWRLLN